MRSKKDLPINGVISNLSIPIEHVEPGMHFCFDGKALIVSPEEPIIGAWAMAVALWSMDSESPNVQTIIEGSIRPSGEYIAFHVACRPGIKDRGLHLSVVAYWIIYGDLKLEDIGQLRFSGLCVDSFCPMTNIKTETADKCNTITVTTRPEDVVDLGFAIVDDNEFKLSARAYWVYNFYQQIRFKSYLSCEVNSVNYALMKNIYTSIASALRFCLGRGNVDFDIGLCRNTSAGWEIVGEFSALHGRMHIRDEHDKPDVKFVRAQNIDEYFGRIVSSFANGEFRGNELSQSRDDAEIITLPKVIELTSSFEREFRDLFPNDVKHQPKTQRVYDSARGAMYKAAEELPSDAKRIVVRLCKRIEENSLETRIRYACKMMPEVVAIAIFKNTNANRKNTQLGKKLTTMRNDIAHGNELQYDLGAIRGEYKLLINLIFAMRLKRIGVPEQDIARLLNYMG